MNVEIKPAKGFEEITGKIIGEVTRNFYQDTHLALPLFSSFSLEALAEAKIVAPHIPRGLLFEHIPVNWHEQVKKLDAVSLHAAHLRLTPKLASEIKQAGVGLACYPVNDIDRAREMMAWGVDALFTDNFKLLKFF
jgi:glycerophosphoryl diester phosphodiesterase